MRRGAPGSRYRGYLLLVLLVVSAFNTKDRLIFGMALEAIKTDLALSDTQLGFLAGLAFAIFYAVAGVPIARWADRGNRVTIIAAATALWSAAVMALGAASSFLQMLLLRICVAVGEAGFVPPAHSLIADHFIRAARPRAMAIVSLGAPLAALIGYFVAGWLIEIYGWRVTFVILGLPGLALAILVAFTLREPRLKSGHTATTNASARAGPKAHSVFVTLWRIRTFRDLLLAYSVISVFSNGISQWMVPFFIRSYGMRTGEIGAWFALIYGGLGVLGTLFGGELATRFAANNESLQLKCAAAANVLFGLLSVGVYFAPNALAAMALLGLAALGIYAVNGPLFATIQSVVPERLRATSVALLLFFVSLVGAGLGPLIVGIISDLLRDALGDESLRYALAALSPGFVWGAWYYWRASRYVAIDIRLVADATETSPNVSRERSLGEAKQ